jgi:hypothetical protein
MKRATADEIEAIFLKSDTPAVEAIQAAPSRWPAWMIALETMQAEGGDVEYTDAVLWSVVDKLRIAADCTEYTLEGPITPAWLTAIGVFCFEEGSEFSGSVEHTVRIEGGDPLGKESSNEDRKGDEIVYFTVTFQADGKIMCYIESEVVGEEIAGVRTESIVLIGERKTRREILDLLHALQAWGVYYPEAYGPR